MNFSIISVITEKGRQMAAVDMQQQDSISCTIEGVGPLFCVGRIVAIGGTEQDLANKIPNQGIIGNHKR